MEAERIGVLKMIQNKHISAEDGARLLKALVSDRQGAAARPAPPVPAAQPDVGSRWFKVNIEEPSGKRVHIWIE